MIVPQNMKIEQSSKGNIWESIKKMQTILKCELFLKVFENMYVYLII